MKCMSTINTVLVIYWRTGEGQLHTRRFHPEIIELVGNTRAVEQEFNKVRVLTSLRHARVPYVRSDGMPSTFVHAAGGRDGRWQRAYE